MKNENYALNFFKGGKLVFNNWVYDEVTKVGHYEAQDISNDGGWRHKRDLSVWIAPDVTLNDIFLFLARDPDICDIVFCNCYVKRFVDSWGKIAAGDIVTDHSYNPDKIEYLELYWGTELFTYEGKTDISGLSRADFHGIGFELKEDQFDGDWKTHVKGDRIHWGLDFTAIKDMLDLPIRLNSEFKIIEEWDRGKKMDELKTLIDCNRDFSFHEVVEGIMWELSFYGSDEERMEKKDEVMAIKAGIDAGTAELIELKCEDVSIEP
jgi:hypothetical protein